RGDNGRNPPDTAAAASCHAPSPWIFAGILPSRASLAWHAICDPRGQEGGQWRRGQTRKLEMALIPHPRSGSDQFRAGLLTGNAVLAAAASWVLFGSRAITTANSHPDIASPGHPPRTFGAPEGHTAAAARAAS